MFLVRHAVKLSYHSTDEFVPENSETSDDDSVSSGVDEKDDDDEFDEPMSEDEKSTVKHTYFNEN